MAPLPPDNLKDLFLLLQRNQPDVRASEKALRDCQSTAAVCITKAAQSDDKLAAHHADAQRQVRDQFKPVLPMSATQQYDKHCGQVLALSYQASSSPRSIRKASRNVAAFQLCPAMP